MTFPDVDLPTADSWFTNVKIVAAKIQQYIIDPLNALARRLRDSGYITSGIFTASTGVTISSQVGRIEGNVAWVRVNYTVGPTFPGVPITPPASGDIGNVVVMTIADSRFLTASAFADQSLGTSLVGRVAAHAVRTLQDDVVLAAVAGSADIANGDLFTFSGSYLLD